MKKHILLCLLMTSSAAFADTPVTTKSNQKEQIGYSFGYLMGKSNVNTLEDLDLERFMQGFKEGFVGKEASLTNEEMVNVLNQYKKQTDAKELIAFQAIANKNLQTGNDFLAKNAKEQGIQSTKSGLQYQVLKQSSGKKPKPNSQVQVHYEGRLLDGTVFDSSIARDEPVTLSLNQVIKGWQEGLPLMSEGSKYRFFIPAKLGYGEVGSGEGIPPNSALIFEIELLKIVS